MQNAHLHFCTQVLMPSIYYTHPCAHMYLNMLNIVLNLTCLMCSYAIKGYEGTLCPLLSCLYHGLAFVNIDKYQHVSGGNYMEHVERD